MATRIVGETYLHTDEQVRGYTNAALEAADELGLSPEDRAVILPKMIELYAQKNVQMEQVGPLGIPGMAIPRG